VVVIQSVSPLLWDAMERAMEIRAMELCYVLHGYPCLLFLIPFKLIALHILR
jgi:hypothetical protein